MPEEKQTAAQTTAEAGIVEHAADDQKETVKEPFSGNAPENGTEELPLAEGSDGAPAEKADPKEEKPQSKEQNAENAKRRREAERKAELKKAEEAARYSAILDVLGGVNPYTKDAMKDQADVEEFLAMREIEKNGGDPIGDYRKFVKDKGREEVQKAEKEAAQSERYQKDLSDFEEKHPNTDLDALMKDPLFGNYAKGKVGVIPLSEIYDGYLSMTAEFDKRAKAVAAQMLANQKASPGALSSSTPAEAGFYTKEQVEAMSKEEIHENYDKIRESMKHWKK